MSTKLVGGLLLYAGGALIGGGLSALIYEIVDEIQFRKMVKAEEEKRSIVVYAGGEKHVLNPTELTYEKVDDDGQPDEEGLVDERNEAAYQKSMTPGKKKLKIGRAKDEERQTTDYTKFQKEKESLEDLASRYKTSIVPEEAEKPVESYPPHPFIISLEDYQGGQGSQIYVQLSYYDGDKVLTEDTGEKVLEPGKLLGPDWQNGFDGQISGDPDIVFIRNMILGFDYEVSRIHDTYKRVVLGIVDEPIIQPPARKSRTVRTNPVRRPPVNEEDDEG